MHRIRAYLNKSQLKNIYNKIIPVEYKNTLPAYITEARLESIEPQVNSLIKALNSDEISLIQLLLYPKQQYLESFTDEEKEILYYLKNIGLVDIDTGLVINQKIQLVIHYNLYFFIDARMSFPSIGISEVYIGADSLLLVNHILNDRKLMNQASNILDLCTGTGICGMSLVASGVAQTAVLVDIADMALELARLNIEVNGLSEKVILINEDILNTIQKPEKYDIVVSNPPFVPVWLPEKWKFPIYAQGIDDDGLGYYREIIKNLTGILSLNGKCYLVGAFPGDEEKPFILDELKKQYSQLFEIEMHIYQKINVNIYIDRYPSIMKKYNSFCNMEEVAEVTYEFLIKRYEARNMFIGVLEISYTEAYLIQKNI